MYIYIYVYTVYIYIIIYFYSIYMLHIYIYIYTHMNGGQNYLPAIDMAKVGGPLSFVKACTSMLCTRIGYR